MEIFAIVRKFYKPKVGIYQHLYFHGKFRTKTISGKPFYMNNYCTPFENVIFWEGLESSWEKYSIRIWEILAQKASVIFDIGANTGVYSLVGKATNPNAEIFAFEPLERMYDRLIENIALNGFRINCFQIALADFDGEATLYDLPKDIMRQASLNQSAISDGLLKEHIVRVMTLRSFISENNIERIDLMKIDVETFEPQVLAGMGKYLKKFKPTILIEILNEQIAVTIQSMLNDAGYSCFYRINEEEGLEETDRIDGKARNNYLSRNYLCSFNKDNLLTLLDE